MANFTNNVFLQISELFHTHRGLSRTLATSKMQFFVTLVNSLKSLTNATKSSILDVAGDVGMPLAACK